MTVFRRLSLLALVTSLIQIASGGLVRATGSGDGCPDWPKCFGRWIPPLEHHALIEYSHRLNATIAILAVMATVVVAVARHRRERRIVVPSVVAAFTIVGLAGIGAAVVKSGLNETTVTIHIAIAMALIGTLTYATVNAFCLERFAAGKVKEPVAPAVARFATASAVGTFLLILAGAYVRGENAGLAFPDWPLMNGGLIPDLQGPAIPHFVHRVTALAVGILLAAFVVKALRARPRDAAVSAFAVAAGSLFVVQSFVGALQIWTTLAPAPVALHVALSSLIWAALVAAFTVTRRLATCAVPLSDAERAETTRRPQEAVPAEIGRSKVESVERISPDARERKSATGWRGSVRAYVRLTKPRIVELLLVTTVPTMILAERGIPSLWLMFATVFGGALAAGSANTINMYFDRDIDSLMGRTRARPLPAHEVDPARALVFGVILAIVSFAFMTATVNLLSAVLTQAAVLFYVLVYTLVLKRSTPHNIVIGGAAGCVPVLVGWSAVTGTVGWEAVVLFAIVFFWTPAHFWALAMRYAKDYAAAGVPMLPVVAGARETQRQIMLYSFATVAVTLVLTPVAGMGAIYLTAAAFLGGWLIRHAVELRRRGTPQAAMGMFRFSISYLALLFASMGVDTVVHITT